MSYFIHVCLGCGQQARGPGGHHVAGDNSCGHGTPSHPDGASQPTLARIEVEVRDLGTRSHLARAARISEQLQKEHIERLVDRAVPE